jgi:hypothetical protein
MHGHEVPANRAALAFATSAALEDIVVELDRLVVAAALDRAGRSSPASA